MMKNALEEKWIPMITADRKHAMASLLDLMESPQEYWFFDTAKAVEVISLMRLLQHIMYASDYQHQEDDDVFKRCVEHLKKHADKFDEENFLQLKNITFSDTLKDGVWKPVKIADLFVKFGVNGNLMNYRHLQDERYDSNIFMSILTLMSFGNGGRNSPYEMNGKQLSNKKIIHEYVDNFNKFIDGTSCYVVYDNLMYTLLKNTVELDGVTAKETKCKAFWELSFDEFPWEVVNGDQLKPKGDADLYTRSYMGSLLPLRFLVKYDAKKQKMIFGAGFKYHPKDKDRKACFDKSVICDYDEEIGEDSEKMRFSHHRFIAEDTLFKIGFLYQKSSPLNAKICEQLNMNINNAVLWFGQYLVKVDGPAQNKPLSTSCSFLRYPHDFSNLSHIFKKMDDYYNDCDKTVKDAFQKCHDLFSKQRKKKFPTSGNKIKSVFSKMCRKAQYSEFDAYMAETYASGIRALSEAKKDDREFVLIDICKKIQRKTMNFYYSVSFSDSTLRNIHILNEPHVKSFQ